MEKILSLQPTFMFFGIGLCYASACMLIELPINSMNTNMLFERFVKKVAYFSFFGGILCFVIAVILKFAE